MRGLDYRLYLPEGVQYSAPAWNAQGGRNPSLLPARAVLLARKALGKSFADAATWSLDSVELREIPTIDPLSGLPVGTGKWYYQICFRPPGKMVSVWNDTRNEMEHDGMDYKMFVLLNGMVIMPKPTDKVAPDGATGGN